MAIFFRKLLLSTQLPAEEVRRRLNEHISATDKMKRFEGKASADTFHIVRVRGQASNAFAAQVNGAIEAAPGETSVRLTMRPAPFSFVFVFAWVGLALVGAFEFMALSTTFFRFVPFGMLLFGCAIFIGAFHYSANECRDLLMHLLDAEKATP